MIKKLFAFCLLFSLLSVAGAAGTPARNDPPPAPVEGINNDTVVTYFPADHVNVAASIPELLVCPQYDEKNSKCPNWIYLNNYRLPGYTLHSVQMIPMYGGYQLSVMMVFNKTR